MENKKGQVFLLGAIVIVLALLTVTGTYNSVKAYPDIQDYKENTANYLTEYPKVVNDARYTNVPESLRVDDFSRKFINQAKTKDPNFGIVYTYKDSDGKIHIVNTLTNKVITVQLTGATSSQLESIQVRGYESVDDQVCISGVGCTTTNSRISDFGGSFANEINLDTELRDKTKIKVCLGSGNTQCTSPISIGDFSANIITQSQTDLSTLGGQGTVRTNSNEIIVDVTVSNI